MKKHYQKILLIFPLLIIIDYFFAHILNNTTQLIQNYSFYMAFFQGFDS